MVAQIIARTMIDIASSIATPEGSDEGSKKMPRGPCTFRQRDVTRAIKSLQAAGCRVARVEFAKDKFIVLIGDEQEQPARDGVENEWDSVS